MNELMSLFEIVLTVGAIAAPAILINRLVAGSEGATLADLFAIAVDPSRARGIQEEEPVRWHIERLSSYRSYRQTEGHQLASGRPRAIGATAIESAATIVRCA